MNRIVKSLETLEGKFVNFEGNKSKKIYENIKDKLLMNYNWKSVVLLEQMIHKL